MFSACQVLGDHIFVVTNGEIICIAAVMNLFIAATQVSACPEEFIECILVIDGKSQRFALTPADGSKLVGTAPAPVKPGVKGAIQLTAPDGESAQAKF